MNSVHVDDWIPNEQSLLAIEFFLFESGQFESGSFMTKHSKNTQKDSQQSVYFCPARI